MSIKKPTGIIKNAAILINCRHIHLEPKGKFITTALYRNLKKHSLVSFVSLMKQQKHCLHRKAIGINISFGNLLHEVGTHYHEN